jgi:hypothetical protein
MICTVCNKPLKKGQMAMWGIILASKWRFGWCCYHQPVGDVDVILSSSECAAKWINQHPEAEQQFLFTLKEYERGNNNSGNGPTKPQ